MPLRPLRRQRLKRPHAAPNPSTAPIDPLTAWRIEQERFFAAQEPPVRPFPPRVTLPRPQVPTNPAERPSEALNARFPPQVPIPPPHCPLSPHSGSQRLFSGVREVPRLRGGARWSHAAVICVVNRPCAGSSGTFPGIPYKVPRFESTERSQRLPLRITALVAAYVPAVGNVSTVHGARCTPTVAGTATVARNLHHAASPNPQTHFRR